MSEVKSDLHQLRNIGPKTISWLHDAGIYTIKELQQLGSVEAYKRLKHLYPQRVSLNALYGLEAALMDIHWNDLPTDIKADLKAQAADI